MKKLLSSLKYDILFQFRHGFYYVYAIVSVIYIAILRSIPAGPREIVTVLLVFADTSILGFFFIGGIVLLEKSQGTLENLFVTPLSLFIYFSSKILSLTMIAVIMSSAIMIAANGIPPHFIQFIIGVIISSILFTLIGLTLSGRVRNVNEYLILSVVYLFPFILPVISHLNLFNSYFFYIFPTKASLILLDAGFKGLTSGQALYVLVNLAIWLVIAYFWAYKWFVKYVLLRIGGGK